MFVFLEAARTTRKTTDVNAPGLCVCILLTDNMSSFWSDFYFIYIFISPEAGSQKNKQTRKQQAKNKYIAKEISTIHHACTWQEAWLDENGTLQ